jgi:hypothetical protein
MTRQCQAEMKQTNKHRRQAHVEILLDARRERKVSAENQEKLELSRCEFTFNDSADAAAISFALDGGRLIVESVDRARKVLACLVLPKYTVCALQQRAKLRRFH